MRLSALAFAAALLAAPAAFAHDDDDRKHSSDRYYSSRHQGDYGGPWGAHDRYRYGDDYRGRYYSHGYSKRHKSYRDDRILIEIPAGAYFGRGYDVYVGEYYRKPCRRYADYRGHWDRPYRIGHALPDHVVWARPPREIVRYLPPAPYGHSYVSVDRDVLLVAEASKQVIDAIVLLSGD